MLNCLAVKHAGDVDAGQPVLIAVRGPEAHDEAMTVLADGEVSLPGIERIGDDAHGPVLIDGSGLEPKLDGETLPGLKAPKKGSGSFRADQHTRRPESDVAVAVPLRTIRDGLERPEKIKRLKQDVKHENEVRHGANAYQQQRFAFESRVDDATPPALGTTKCPVLFSVSESV